MVATVVTTTVPGPGTVIRTAVFGMFTHTCRRKLGLAPAMSQTMRDPAPAGPCVPFMPAGPWGPGGPAGPAAPGAPFDPAGPCVPAGPWGPGAPFVPSAPAGPRGPTGPGAPGAAAGPGQTKFRARAAPATTKAPMLNG